MEASVSWDDETPEQKAAQLRELEDTIVENLVAAGKDIGVRIRRDAQSKAPVDETRLRDSITSNTQKSGSRVRTSIGTNVEYARYHEEGRDPFWPPPSELRGWASRQLGDPDLAFVVARAIAGESPSGAEGGIEEKRFLRDALQENEDWANDRFKQAIQSAYDEVFG